MLIISSKACPLEKRMTRAAINALAFMVVGLGEFVVVKKKKCEKKKWMCAPIWEKTTFF